MEYYDYVELRRLYDETKERCDALTAKLERTLHDNIKLLEKYAELQRRVSSIGKDARRIVPFVDVVQSKISGGGIIRTTKNNWK
jgi:predicted nuclease with TOPRIM domain